MIMKDITSYLVNVVNVANVDTVYKTYVRRASGEYLYLEIQVRGIKHSLSYGRDEALRDADYDRLKQADQH